MWISGPGGGCTNTSHHRFISEECAADCFLPLLADGECQPECFNLACEFDKGDWWVLARAAHTSRWDSLCHKAGDMSYGVKRSDMHE